MTTLDATQEAVTCASCGSVIPAGRRRCPKCGRPRAPRWPERGFALYLNEADAPMQQLHSHVVEAKPLPPSSGLFPWIEFAAGCFGFNGIGLFLTGKRTRGILWFAFSLLRHAASIPILALTAGIGLVCIVPLNVGIAIYLALSVGRILRREEHALASPTR